MQSLKFLVIAGLASGAATFVGPSHAVPAFRVVQSPTLPTTGHPNLQPRSTTLFGLKDEINEVWEWSETNLLPTLGGLALVALLSSVTIINTGEIGIVNRLGELSQLDSGLHFVVPFRTSEPKST